MKRIIFLLLLISLNKKTFSQTDEAQQLLLNVEKLAQLKQILKDMYKGYEIVSKGYNTIKNISEGNFDLHKVFLDGLMQVSPIVKKYKRVIDIIDRQGQIVKEYKSAFSRFRNSGQFNLSEINYMSQVYTSLLEKSLQGLNELLMVITANQLRMSDEERLAAIDKIFAGMEDKLSFLRSFNRSTSVLAMQRGREAIDTKISQQIYGVH
jgi:uncharacterized protein (UPF0297 family)